MIAMNPGGVSTRILGLQVSSLVSIWFFLSAFYYAGNFLSGNLIVGVDEDLVHRLAKYAVALLICFVYLLVRPSWNLLSFYSFIAILSISFIFMAGSGLDVLYPVTLLLVICSFAGFTYISADLPDRDVSTILDYVIYSAFLVSLITFYEYYFMWPVLGGYWEATGGYRSVSTLLNPNNLGVYLGCALIILFLRKKFPLWIRVCFILSISAAMLMSGSRTAVVSLILPVLFGAIFNGFFKVRVKPLILLFLLSLCLLVYLSVNAFSFYDFGGRFSDMQTASIRLAKYSHFLLSFDYTYFTPDFNSARTYYVSESSYFHFLNSFGLLISLLFCVFCVFLFRPDLGRAKAGPSIRVLAFIFFYYLIVFFFENAFLSFPNNQLFFFAAGALMRPIKYTAEQKVYI